MNSTAASTATRPPIAAGMCCAPAPLVGAAVVDAAAGDEDVAEAAPPSVELVPPVVAAGLDVEVTKLVALLPLADTAPATEEDSLAAADEAEDTPEL